MVRNIIATEISTLTARIRELEELNCITVYLNKTEDSCDTIQTLALEAEDEYKISQQSEYLAKLNSQIKYFEQKINEPFIDCPTICINYIQHK